MRRLKTYKLFESSEPIIDRLEDCFVDLEDMGLTVKYGVEEGMLTVFIQKKLSSGYQESFLAKDVISTIEFANSYSLSELGLSLDGINFTYYNSDEEDTAGSYVKDIDGMIDFLEDVTYTKRVYDILLAYKKI